jgi:hypothetical protein
MQATTNGQVTIYALTDPDSGEVCYVGRTANNALQRYSEHLLRTRKASPRWAWIQALREQRKVPTLKILQEHVSAEDAAGREEYWIAYWREQGAVLLNALLSPSSPGTVQELLRAHGVHTLKEFYTRLNMRKQYAWLLWHSKIALSWEMAQRLHQVFGLSFEELGQVERSTPAKPRGRPPQPHAPEPPKGRRRKRPPEPPSEEGQPCS